MMDYDEFQKRMQGSCLDPFEIRVAAGWSRECYEASLDYWRRAARIAAHSNLERRALEAVCYDFLSVFNTLYGIYPQKGESPRRDDEGAVSKAKDAVRKRLTALKRWAPDEAPDEAPAEVVGLCPTTGRRLVWCNYNLVVGESHLVGF